MKVGESQFGSLSEIQNDAWDIFQKVAYLNVSSLLTKINEISFIDRLTNTTVLN